MSSYTSMIFKAYSKRKMSENELSKLMLILSNDCGTKSYKNIEGSLIDFSVTFYHLEHAVELVNFLESIVEFEQISDVGEFKTEEIAGFNNANILMFKNKIFFLIEESYCGIGYNQVSYHVNDLRGNKLDDSFCIDKNSFDDIFYKGYFIGKFLSSIKN